MKKNKTIIRFYLTPILAAVAALAFWWVFREDKTYYWWLGLIALITAVHYWAYWKDGRTLALGKADQQFPESR